MKKLLELIEPSGLAYGGVRFLLTPIPWEIEGYKFLLPSAIFHWMMFLPAIAGAVMLWRESKLARLVLLYGLTIIAFYAVVDDLQGVRHRYQISFVFIWAQFHFIYRWNHAPNWEPSLEPSSPSVLSSRLPRTQS